MKKENLIIPPNINFPRVTALFSTRAIDDPLNAVSNNIASVYLPVQRHTSKVHILRNDTTPVIADSVITNRKRILIGVQVADCIPILLYDKRRKVIGAVHAGWRGTAKGILKNSITVMCEEFDSSPLDILIAMGPSIKGCCYEVGQEVIESVERVIGRGEYYRGIGGRNYLDLSHANMIQALSTGIPEDNIWCSEECTSCDPERFYSYRHARGSTGRQGGFIGMW